MTESKAPRATKRCPSPGHAGPNPLPLSEFYRASTRPGGYSSWCKACDRAASRARRNQWRQSDPDNARKVDRQWQRSNRGKVREFSRRSHTKVRAMVLDHYGRACACCGATDRLTIDHINGDGKQHRAELRTYGSDGLYAWLITNGFPDGFQTLCGPCNGSKGNGERCQLNHGVASS